MPRTLLPALAVSLALATTFAFADETKPVAPSPSIARIEVHPARLVLNGPRDARRVLVTGVTPEGQRVDLSSKAVYKTLSPALVVDSEGYIHPRADGASEIEVSVGDQSTRVPVDVSHSTEAHSISFVRDVQPILSKVGCNQGTCHGSAKGKNGFKLSLRGYDAAFDYAQLVDDLAGRRFNRADPTQSLMLLKPTNAVPHQGGYVLDPESPRYGILREWIAEGVRSDVDTTARVASLEVFPPSVDLAREGDEQQLLVIAQYPDGTTRDITRDAIFESSVPEVATVTQSGRISAVRRGEASVLVKYEGSFGVANLMVMGDRTGFAWQPMEEYGPIDRFVNQKLERAKILPSELCSDDEFLRRASLDLTGLPPSPEKVRAFLADTTSGRAKREALVDELIGSPEFVQHWTHKLADLLQVNRKLVGDKATWAYLRWIEQAVASNMPYDQMVRRLMTAEGGSFENPAVNYFRASKEPTVALENATHLFLGIRFNCNKCHDHPFERWTQGQYYGMAAFWGQVGQKGGSRPGEQVVYDRPSGDITHPKDGRVVPPAFPYQHAGKVREGVSRREQLADWLTARENPYFARSAANRLWSYLLGRGIIDPVDDIRQSNPPSNPALLAFLEKEMIDSGFNLRHVLRLIATSRTYQASFKTNEFNYDDASNFSHALPRRLTAEQLLDAIDVATGHTPRFAGVPAGFRANQLPDSQSAGGGFLDLFGRPARETPCECERSSEVSLAQALNLLNGTTISDALIDPEGRIARLMKSNPDDRTIVDEVYLAALSRFPTDDERGKGVAYLTGSENRAEGAQDLMWALINSPAFLFNR